MKTASIFRMLLLGVLTIIMSLSAEALDLKKKNVNGRQVYYYKVKKGESMYGVAKKIGLTQEEIVRQNPQAANGLKKDMMLYFPVEEYETPTLVEQEEESVPEVEAEVTVNPSVAIILPFGLGQNEQTRQNKLALDFYRGFLIAADTLSNRPGALDINVYDCSTVGQLQNLFSTTPEIADASVIVGPEDESLLNEIERFALETNTYVMNVFSVRDSAYLTNPRVLQANIPQKEMYALAIKAFMEMYQDYQPVILRNEKGRNEKEGFVEALEQEFKKRDIKPIKIKYDGTLLTGELDVLQGSGARKFIFIPSSGALSEFHKFALVIKALRDRAEDAIVTSETDVEPTEYALFGYPDWVAFRGEALELLQKLNARVYSRFYDNFLGFDSRIIGDDFRFWYGREMIESIPTSGLLGYDTGSYIIRNIRANGAFNPEWKVDYQGIQSVFHFDRAAGAGYFNNALYIVDFLPEGRMTKRIVY